VYGVGVKQNNTDMPPPDLRVLFGKRVRELRLKRGLSQEELAELTGLHHNYVGSVERGERNISLVNIVKIARGLSVTPSTLIETIR
jgi:transcriptional regulator with XRE-family HTH domain